MGFWKRLFRRKTILQRRIAKIAIPKISRDESHTYLETETDGNLYRYMGLKTKVQAEHYAKKQKQIGVCVIYTQRYMGPIVGKAALMNRV